MSRQKSRLGDDSSPAIRARILEAIERAGLTPADVDRRLHLSEDYMGKILRGERRLTPRHVAEISLLTKATEEFLRTGEKAGARCGAAHPGGQNEGHTCGSAESKHPLRDTVYKCWRCRGEIDRGAHVCPHCTANFEWPVYQDREADIAHGEAAGR